MKTITTLLTSLTASGLLVLADDQAASQLTKAARQTSEEKNYTWISTSSSAAGTHDWKQGPTQGKTEKAGYTYISFTMGDGTIELGFHKDKSAIKWADKWHGESDLKNDLTWIADRLKTYKFAADEAVFLATHSPDLTSPQENEFVGSIDEEALRYLLSRGRREINDVKEIKGTVHFWLQDGHLKQYEYNIKGPAPLGKEGAMVTLDRTTRVEIKDVNNTEVKTPAEAVEKLQ